MNQDRICCRAVFSVWSERGSNNDLKNIVKMKKKL